MDAAAAVLSRAAEDMLRAKKEGSPTEAETVSAFGARDCGALAIVDLKRHNRDVFEAMDAKRQKTMEAKQQVLFFAA